MRVGVQQPVLEHLRAEAADENLEQRGRGRARRPRRVARRRRGSRSAARRARCSSTSTRRDESSAWTRGTTTSGSPAKQRAKAAACCASALVVELGAHARGQLARDRVEVESGSRSRSIGTTTSQRREVGLDDRLDAGHLHLDGDPRAVGELGGVHLRERCGGDRLVVEAGEERVGGRPELVVDALRDAPRAGTGGTRSCRRESAAT